MSPFIKKKIYFLLPINIPSIVDLSLSIKYSFTPKGLSISLGREDIYKKQ